MHPTDRSVLILIIKSFTKQSIYSLIFYVCFYSYAFVVRTHTITHIAPIKKPAITSVGKLTPVKTLLKPIEIV